MIGRIISAVLLVVVGLALLPVVLDIVDDIALEATGITKTLVELMPILYVLMLVVAAIAVIKVRFGSGGGGGD